MTVAVDPREAIEQMTRLAGALSPAALTELSGPDLMEFERRRHALTETLRAWESVTLAELDSRRVTTEHAGVATATWVRAERNQTLRAARARVLAACETVKEPRVVEAIAHARLSEPNTATVIRTLGSLGPLVPDRVRTQAREFLLAHAHLDPAALKRVAERLVEVVDGATLQDEQERQAAKDLRAHAGRYLKAVVSGARTRIAISLQTSQWLRVRPVLEAYAERIRRTDPLPSSRGARLADAFVQSLSNEQQRGTAPRLGGDRPTAIILLDYETLVAECGQILGRGGVGTRILRTPGSTATNPLWHGPACAAGAAPFGPRGARAAPPFSFPDLFGTSTQARHRSTSDGFALTIPQMRRLLCDCDILPMVLSGEGLPLDVGRASRRVPPALRKALIVRDGGCIFPGCEALPQECEAHHVEPWEHCGETSLDNLCLLCPHHHATVQHDPGDRDHYVVIMENGMPSVIPPYRVDPLRRPIPHDRYRFTQPSRASQTDPPEAHRHRPAPGGPAPPSTTGDEPAGTARKDHGPPEA
ncbi:MAG: HNH endonuclease signature motif containing protein [Bowdeniella nasicola]|nr:HNH endonuclease signature motif containing protein [Bowdeniella nasicola]